MRKVWQFLQYNNAIPIGLFVLFGGTGAVFAASPEAQQAVYDSHEEVQSVDNTYIVGADLAQRDFGLKITAVTEDSDNYYIAYTYRTITIVDYIWQDVPVSKSVTYSKKELMGKDLGLFLAKQLGEEMVHELSYLTEVQMKERTVGTTLKKVATEYSGLIGRMLNPTEKTFPGYAPVVEEQQTPSGLNAAAAGLASGGVSPAVLPPAPTQQDIENMVAAAVARALAQQNQTASTTTPQPPPTPEPEPTPEPAPEPTPEPEPAPTSTPPTPEPTPEPEQAATSTPPTPEPEPPPAEEPPPADEPAPEPSPEPPPSDTPPTP